MADATEHHHFIPIDRFRYIMGSLELRSKSFTDAFWLRFAALAVVLVPDHTELLARKIRRCAQRLAEHAPWYSDFASPMRFVIAATLIATHDTPKDFLAFHHRTRETFGEEGIRRGDPYETIAILILRQSHRRRHLDTIDAARLRAIYEGMKEYHWWLTGPDDLPACALLATTPLTARELATHIESCYQQLRDAGFPAENELQTVANLMPVVDGPPPGTVTRYLEIHGECQERLPEGHRIHPSSIVALCMLPQTADDIVTRLRGIYDELQLSEDRRFEESDFALAADLTFLDLVQFAADLEPLVDGPEIERKFELLHRFHLLTTAVLADLDALQEHDASHEVIWFP